MFGITFHAAITTGAARWEIGTIFSEATNAERWRKYLYLTKDFDTQSDEPLSFNEAELNNTIVPEDWRAEQEVEAFQAEIAAQIIASVSPYDDPQPLVVFPGQVFCFTGKFDFGPRKACENLIYEKEGIPAKGVSTDLDYLVIGTQGNPAWKRGSYGTKIQRAILLRRERGKPAIISEDHLLSFL